MTIPFGFGLSGHTVAAAAMLLLVASSVTGAAPRSLDRPSGVLTSQQFAAVQAANTLLTNPSPRVRVFADGFEGAN